MNTAASLADSEAKSKSVAALSVVVPVLDEAESITHLVSEIAAALQDRLSFEIIVVDDGGSDDAVPKLRALREREGLPLRILRHRENFGQSAALWTGIAAARAQWIATLDGDGQNDPADIPRLFAMLNADDGAPPLQLICGRRERRRDSAVKRLSSRIANAVRSRMLSDHTPDTGCGLKLINRACFLSLPRFDHMHRFIPALVQRAGGRSVSVSVRHRPRTAGRSKYTIGNRLWIGIVDLFGVMWLQRRQFKTDFEEL